MSDRGLRIVFAGTPAFAAHHLQALLDSRHQLVAVYTQPDRPAGRGKKLQPSPVKALALAHDLPVYQPLSLKDPAAQAELAALDADLMVVVAYGLLLPKAVLDTPRLGCVNVHGSILPRWRGAAPIERAIMAGDAETGVTIMQMDVGLDTGDMLLISRCPIGPVDTGDSLRDTLAALGAPALLQTLEQLQAGSAQPVKQDDSQANYAHKIDKAETAIDWSQSADCIARRIRALVSLYVGHSSLGGERVKLWAAEPAEGQGAPGEIIAADKRGILVACGEGAVRLSRLQLPGGKPLDCAALLNARAALFAPGNRFTSEMPTA